MTLTRRQLMAACGTLAAGVSTLTGITRAAASSTVLKPKRLRSGMTVGLVTPASNVPEDQDLHAAI